MTSRVTLAAVTEWPAYSVPAPGAPLRITACVTAAAHLVPGAEKRRIGLMLVVDVSGSMNSSLGIRDGTITTRLDAAKTALCALLRVAASYPTADVTVSLVAYSDAATLVLAAVALGAAAELDAALAAVNALAAGGGTNIAAALDAAHTAADRLRGLDMPVHIFLFTDGDADANEENAPAALCAKAAAGPPLHTLAFGADAERALMRAMAEAGAGHFYDAKSLGDMAHAFGVCLGRGLALAAAAPTLTVTPLGGARLQVGAAYTTEAWEQRAGDDMLTGESRDWLFEFELPAVDADKEVDPVRATDEVNFFQARSTDFATATATVARPLFSATLEYTGRDAGAPTLLTTNVGVTVSAAPVAVGAPAAAVVKTRARLYLAGVLEAASAETDFDTARALVQACRQDLLTMARADVDVTDLLRQLDLVQLNDLTTADHFGRQGAAHMAMRSEECYTQSAHEALGAGSGFMVDDVRNLSFGLTSAVAAAEAADDDDEEEDEDADAAAADDEDDEDADADDTEPHEHVMPRGRFNYITRRLFQKHGADIPHISDNVLGELQRRVEAQVMAKMQNGRPAKRARVQAAASTSGWTEALGGLGICAPPESQPMDEDV